MLPDISHWKSLHSIIFIFDQLKIYSSFIDLYYLSQAQTYLEERMSGQS